MRSCIVVLLGHLHPDGDCVSTCLGMYNYLSEKYPQLTVDLYLTIGRKVFL